MLTHKNNNNTQKQNEECNELSPYLKSLLTGKKNKICFQKVLLLRQWNLLLPLLQLENPPHKTLVFSLSSNPLSSQSNLRMMVPSLKLSVPSGKLSLSLPIPSLSLEFFTPLPISPTTCPPKKWKPPSSNLLEMLFSRSCPPNYQKKNASLLSSPEKLPQLSSSPWKKTIAKKKTSTLLQPSPKVTQQKLPLSLSPQLPTF